MKTISPLLAALGLSAAGAFAQVNTVQNIAPGVYFHEGDPRQGHSNNGWIVFDDFVLLVDANFPSGAKVVSPRVRETTDKPVRVVFDTHHHGDHAYGNKVWVDAGALTVAHVGVLEEMKRLETGAFGGPPGRWEDSAKKRPDVAASKLSPPTALFPNQMFFEDRGHRVELRHLGVGHTRGDAVAWLPKEKILFTGDACVNSASNAVMDASMLDWIKTLELMKQLGAEKVCPGHGPMGGPEVIADQQTYFIELRRAVQALVDAKKTSAEVKAAVPAIGEELKKNPRITRYVQANSTAHVQKMYLELGGELFPK